MKSSSTIWTEFCSLKFEPARPLDERPNGCPSEICSANKASLDAIFLRWNTSRIELKAPRKSVPAIQSQQEAFEIICLFTLHITAACDLMRNDEWNACMRVP